MFTPSWESLLQLVVLCRHDPFLVWPVVHEVESNRVENLPEIDGIGQYETVLERVSILALAFEVE